MDLRFDRIGPIISCVLVCSFVHAFVRPLVQSFCQSWLNSVFSDFCMKLGVNMLKSDSSIFVKQLSLTQIWAKMAQKWGILHFFENFCLLFFLKLMQNESSFNSWLLIANPMSGKILVLELFPKM